MLPGSAGRPSKQEEQLLSEERKAGKGSQTVQRPPATRDRNEHTSRGQCFQTLEILLSLRTVCVQTPLLTEK